MSKKRSWTDEKLIESVSKHESYRAVIIDLGLIPAGGNYAQVKKRIKELGLSADHFTGKGWNVGLRFRPTSPIPLEEILVPDSDYQSHTLKPRLFNAGIKKPICEMCGWSRRSADGRIPIELDHINGDHRDNRL